MNAETCTICRKKLVDKRILRSHMQTIHKQYVQTNRFECDECVFAHKEVIELETRRSFDVYIKHEKL